MNSLAKLISKQLKAFQSLSTRKSNLAQLLFHFRRTRSNWKKIEAGNERQSLQASKRPAINDKNVTEMPSQERLPHGLPLIRQPRNVG